MASRPTERARQYAVTRFGELARVGSSRRDLQLRSTALIAEVLRHPDPSVAFYEVEADGSLLFVGSNGGNDSEPGDSLPQAYEALVRSSLATGEIKQSVDVDGTGQVTAITTQANHGNQGLYLVRRSSVSTEDEAAANPDGEQPSDGALSEEELTFVETLGRLIAMASERQMAVNRPRQPHQHDPLTRLPNQQLFHERLEATLERATRATTEIGVLFIDIDHFEMINTSYGKMIGDRLLTKVAGRLREALRPGDFLARFHGDTFIALCEELRGTAGIGRVANRLQRAFDDPFGIDGEKIHLGVSIGGQTTDRRRPSRHTSTALLRDADIALGQAKRLGRAQSVTFAEDMHGQTADRMLIETDLRSTLANRELALQYQPIIELASTSVYGAEALVRWNHPDRGSISPAYFIAVAEESGLIDQVDSWVLTEAITSSRAWSGTTDASRVVSVNVSDRQFSAGHLTHTVAEALRETEAAPELLCFEFEESALVGDLSRAERSLHELRDLGVLLAIDHFGTGHLPLGALGRLPIDIVKVDPAFVRNLRTSSNDKNNDNAVTAATINLAQTLGMKVLATGVETEEQRDVLAELGCDLAQGWWFSPPVAAEGLGQDLVGYRKSLLRSDA